MTGQEPLLFVDSNVLIEAILIPLSPAAIITDLVASGTFDMATCALAVADVERAVMSKIHDTAELDIVIQRWEELKQRLRLKILSDPSLEESKQVYEKYIGVMRHKADIPILASALSCRPVPFVILSANREHFNDLVAARCGIKILSCSEFLAMLAGLQP
jgi:hypothetical protein